jgi:beta-1,2-mannobiose phosphorylase / 1,2-beta-oligomannan phosphorylase
MAVKRVPENPIIEPADVQPSLANYEVICVINAGVARLGDEVILLLRVVERPVNHNDQVYLAPIFDPVQGKVIPKEIPRDAPGHDFTDPRLIQTPEGTYLTALSHLRLARSKDGVNFHIDPHPAIFPENVYETFGIEDPRISLIDGTYYINYVGVSRLGIVTSLASTTDFKHYRRLGVIFPPDNKDVEIFPEKINGKYYALHRPSTSAFGRPEIWLADSPDLLCWGNHRHLIGQRDNNWENGRIGGSAVPFRTEQGWLAIYHGANKNDRYSLAALLLDADDPGKVLARSNRPILEPEADYEVHGFFANVVFTCGVLYEDGIVKIYYGAADTSMAYAEMPIEDIFDTFAW